MESWPISPKNSPVQKEQKRLKKPQVSTNELLTSYITCFDIHSQIFLSPP